MNSVLVLGQTPPPFGGQAIMINHMLGGRYKHATLHHVRMSFSKDMDDMGRWRPGKLLHVISIVARVVYVRIRHNTQVLYYPPSGPDFLPMMRDMALLIAIRWMFKKTIFHFHAAGISELYPRLHRYLQAIYRWSYFDPDIAIRLSEFNPDDGHALRAKREFIVPNGIGDEGTNPYSAEKSAHLVCGLLYVGLICETKGILVLIDAVELVRKSGQRLKVTIVGKFTSEDFRQEVMDRIATAGLTEDFDFKGVLTGQAKNNEYVNADIFCFPTFFESESFGLVVVEAMQFRLPVIATQWRGVQSLVQNAENGFLIAPNDSEALAEKILLLATDPMLRAQFGENGRQRFLAKYSLEKFYEKMDECFAAV